MRVRADQVRVGSRLGDAVVTRVQPTLDWGVVRITVTSEPDAPGGSVPSGTFSYLPDDILDVQHPAPSSPGQGLDADPRVRLEPRHRPTRHTGRPPVRYRVEYQATDGDGHLVVRTEDSRTTSLVAHAQELLLRRGVDARIRRIVPMDRGRGDA